MNRLKNLRKEIGLSQQALAKEVGVSYRTLQNWENGVNTIKPDKAQELADFFGVPVGYLLNLDTTIEPRFLILDKTRKHFNLSIETLSVLLGMPKSTLETWEKEKNFIPFKKVAYKLYNYLNITRDDFLKIISENNLEFEFSISGAYTDIENYINNPLKYEKFGQGLTDVNQAFMLIIQKLIESDKEFGTNFADVLINYISLNSSDKQIVFDLIQKMAEKDN